MRIMVLGLRGLPEVQGGVETHAQHLYPRLVALGCEVDVIVRSPYVPAEVREYAGVKLHRLWAPLQTSLEAIVHSFLGVVYAAFSRPDILHIHAVGPSIVAPLARLAGLRVVMTHHGPDYDRDKWGRMAKGVLRTGERWGVRAAHARIAISQVIVDHIQRLYQRGADLIPNGVVPVGTTHGADVLQQFGLTPGNYLLQVSRLVPEKRQLDLIAAFVAERPQGLKLALVGAIDGTDYAKQVVERASGVEDVVLTGFQRGRALAEIYANARGFVLPSSHEGLPIAMLEALSYGLPVLASDIPANLEVGLAPSSYFALGSIDALRAGLRRLLTQDITLDERTKRIDWVQSRYDWDVIAERTMQVYRRLVGPAAGTAQDQPTRR